MLLSLTLLIGHSIFAQEEKLSNRLEPLNFILGDWNVTTYGKDSTGSRVSGALTSAIIGTIHDGGFIKEEVKYQGPAFTINMVTFIGYDPRANKYKLCAMDKEFQVMDIYYGDWSGEKLVFTNLESDKPFDFGNGQTVHFRITYTPTENGFDHKVEGTSDKGANWFYFSHSEFRR